MQKSLYDSVAYLRGVGPKRVQTLNKLGINTIEDLLMYFPFRYDDIALKIPGEVLDGQKVTFKGTVASMPTVVTFGRTKRLQFRLLVADDVVMITFFNQAYLSKQIVIGKEIMIYGKYNAKKQTLVAIKLINDLALSYTGVYRASKDIKVSTIKQMIEQAYLGYSDIISDIIPKSILSRYRLESRKQMIHDMHFPKSKKEADLARRSAVFDEFFRFQVEMQYLKRNDQENNGLLIKYDNQRLREFIKKLPFELTSSQKRVVNEICSDLHKPLHMNRLLQGDVGSGKTIVAAIATYAAVTAGFQVALMAPTAILAQQHAEKFEKLFSPFNINVALLTNATTTKSALKNELLKNILNQNISIVVGTQALIQEGVNFKNLGLVITDEQHRFGVGQRKILRKKGMYPDVLAMTATPIPRTVALTAYGKMDVSIIDKLPKGRKKIETIWLKKRQEKKALDLINEQLKKDSQVYVVSPLIEESEVLDLQNSTEVYFKFKEIFEPKYRVALLHGRMKTDEKNEIMSKFKKREYDILVSTTVIEVGIDIKNATTMLILDADRFGLAQLHQLRGRVGRGSKESYCILLADPRTDYGKERMKTMVETSDGFLIAQKDLELRGPGDVLGFKQSGVLDFKIGDPIKDLKVLNVAQLEVKKILSNPSYEKVSENRGLVSYLKQKKLDFNFD